MRHIAVVLIASFFWVLIYLLKQHRERVLIAAVVIMAIVSGAYCYMHVDGILPKRQPFNQTFYDSKHAETGEFPDAFLRIYLKDKTVLVKADRLTLHESEDLGYEWQYAFYHVENMVNYLKSVGAEAIEDETLNDSCVDKKRVDDFECLGFLNDLLRNSMLYTKFTDHAGSYFLYLWYYRDLAGTSYIYINPDSLNEDELVLLWQPQTEGDVYTEDMYLMGKSYYEDNIK